ncbi:MAG: hypothetical protein ACHQF2_05535 [Flavobacteriales bacterium]
MKSYRLLTFISSFLFATFSFSQGGAKWSVNGNNTSNGDFIGTTNNEPLVIKTNNVTRIRIHANGNIIFKEFDGLGFTGLFTFDANGKLVGVPFSGSPTDVYLGTGVFGNINALTGWFTTPGITYTNNNVGIGLTSPVEKLEVNGNAIFNGSVAASQFLVGDVSSSGKNLRISTNICLDGYDASTGMRNELCVFYKPLYINSRHGYDMNTIINHDNIGNVGIGTDNPTAKLEVNGNIVINGKSYLGRILPLPGDSVVYIGDSTLVFASHNRIYPDYWNWTPSVVTRGTGIGHYTAFGHAEFSVGIGRQARSFANYSVSIGNYVRTSSAALNSMVLGSGVIAVAPLENTIPNSLMVGFNSNLPTLFVGPANGVGSTGVVAVGTTCVPAGYSFAVRGKAIFEEAVVKLSDAQGCWPDYVFEENYQRMTIEQKEIYVTTNKHLPDMPVASDVETNGIEVSSTLTSLTKNVEENTLEIISLYNMIKELQKENEELKKIISGK